LIIAGLDFGSGKAIEEFIFIEGHAGHGPALDELVSLRVELLEQIPRGLFA